MSKRSPFGQGFMLAHFIDSKPFQCGYFQDRRSLFEEYLLEDISETEFEYLLAHGMRHFGDYFFRPRCLECHQCIPIRIRTDEFRMNRSQRRALAGGRGIETRIGTPRFSREKFRMYLEHKSRFQPLQDDVEDEQNFRLSFYVNTQYGIEFEYYMDGRLLGVALADYTEKTFSAIYTFYTRAAEKWSLGTFSVLKQVEFSRLKGIRYFYLGYYIAGNASLNYKSSFRPSEVYIDGQWRPFRNAEGDFLIASDRLAWKNSEALVKAASPNRIIRAGG